MKRLEQSRAHEISLVLNGVPRTGHAETRTLLSDFLRHGLGATGTHVGCEHGVCGACTVRVDGIAVRACLLLAVQVDRRRVDTVEGLAGQDGVLNDLQQAFRRHHALQCGFCTPGILMSCSDFLERIPDPAEQDVREMLSAHLCRCTGYTSIVRAVLEVASARRTNRQETVHA
jgi:2-furoyl-CoA dehydrogenase 2Fe-2S iron sulfur subunit